jgi:hypothetical protein
MPVLRLYQALAGSIKKSHLPEGGFAGKRNNLFRLNMAVAI